MDTQKVAMEELWQQIEELKANVNRKHRRGKYFSSSSTNMVDSDMEAFYLPSHEIRERRSHETRHEEKLFKHNVKFPEFNGDWVPNVIEEWERKVNQIVYSCEFRDMEILKLEMVEFKGYALLWWKKYQKDIIDDKHSQINSWKDFQKSFEKKIYAFHL